MPSNYTKVLGQQKQFSDAISRVKLKFYDQMTDTDHKKQYAKAMAGALMRESKRCRNVILSICMTDLVRYYIEDDWEMSVLKMERDYHVLKLSMLYPAIIAGVKDHFDKQT